MAVLGSYDVKNACQRMRDGLEPCGERALPVISDIPDETIISQPALVTHTHTPGTLQTMSEPSLVWKTHQGELCPNCHTTDLEFNGWLLFSSLHSKGEG